MRHLAVLLLVVFATKTQAQTNDSLLSAPILKLLPSHIFDIDNSLTLGLEVPLTNKRFSVQGDIGFGRNSLNIWQRANFWQGQGRDDVNVETWRTRFQIKYYLIQKRYLGYYVGLQYSFKKNIVKQWQTFGQDCSGSDPWTQICAYQEQKLTTKGRFVNSYGMITGLQWKDRGRFTVDLYLGLGIRNLNVRYLNNSSNPSLNRESDILFFSILPLRVGSYELTPYLYHGIYVGYALKK